MSSNNFFEDSVFEDHYRPPVHDLLKDSSFLQKKKSQLHGFGVFTSIKIHPNSEFYLVPMGGLLSSPAPRAARIATGKFINDEKVLNWVNHSCEANSELSIQQNKIVLRSLREIAPGEEITVDYTLTEEKNNLVQCKCGSAKCRNYFYTT